MRLHPGLHRFKFHIDCDFHFLGNIFPDNFRNFDPVILPGSVNARIDEDWIDPVVGMRWTNALSEQWNLRLRGDIGGFGAASDFTWSAAVGLQYRFSKLFAVELQYKALGVDYEGSRGSPDFFRYDTITHGPLLGVSFEF